MATTEFIDYTSPAISAAWLNDVDALVYDVFGGASTVLTARSALFSGTGVSETEFGYIGTLTSDAQTQINTKLASATAASTYAPIASPTFTGLVTTAGQIAFPATQNASTDVNTLDDYEEGTWTPVVTCGTPGDLSIVYTQQKGRYIKVGRKVDVWARITTSTYTHSTASGTISVTGLPITSDATSGWVYAGSCIWNGITKANYSQVTPYTDDTATRVLFRLSGSGQAVDTLQISDTPSTGSFILEFHLSYWAAS